MMDFIQTLVAAAGGAAIVAICFIKFFANKVADRVAQKYQLKLDKKLEE